MSESETAYKRITVPLANGGALIFDLPDSVGPEQFGEIFEQARQELEIEYRCKHQPPDWAVFADEVQRNLDRMAMA